MNVLHINDYRTLGGAEIVAARSCELLANHGTGARLFSIEDVPSHRFGPWQYVENRAACRAIAAVLDEFDPEVVHLHNFYHRLSPAILGTIHEWRKRSKTRRRIVMTAHDHHLICPNPLMRVMSRRGWELTKAADRLTTAKLLTSRWDHRGRRHSVMRAIQWIWNYRYRDRRAVLDAVLCPSRFIAATLAESGLPVRYVPNPVPAVQAAAAKPDGPLRLVFAGRVEPEKGLAPFIEALPKEFDGRLSVVGDGSALPLCRDVVERRGLSRRITFLGRLSHDETLAVIASAHVLVLPSNCLENAPAVMFEALANRTNLLVSDIGGMREVVEEAGFGYRFDPADAESLRAQLAHIVADHESGTLNAFDPQPVLAERRPETYLEHLLATYTHEGAIAAPRRS